MTIICKFITCMWKKHCISLIIWQCWWRRWHLSTELCLCVVSLLKWRRLTLHYPSTDPRLVRDTLIVLFTYRHAKRIMSALLPSSRLQQKTSTPVCLCHIRWHKLEICILDLRKVRGCLWPCRSSSSGNTKEKMPWQAELDIMNQL